MIFYAALSNTLDLLSMSLRFIFHIRRGSSIVTA